MSSRLTFACIAAFWVGMNVWLWHVEFGVRDSGVPVPVELVWRKILTAPDASSLNIFQHGERVGFCEFSTSVETAMAKLDENSVPPEGVLDRVGYALHLTGNTSLGDFASRLRFDIRLQFSEKRQWRELRLKLSSHLATVEIYSLATNQMVQIKFTSEDGVLERRFTFDELQNPGTLLGELGGNLAGGMVGGLEWPALTLASPGVAPAIPWEARRARLKIGREPVSTYRLETRLLDRTIVIYASTLGEIMRVELPGGVTVTLDEWSKT